MHERPLRKGREYTLTAESAAFEGGCVARYEGMAVFIDGCVPGDTVRALHRHLTAEGLHDHEILVVADGCTDGTMDVLRELEQEVETLRWVINQAPNGFGFAVRRGLEQYRGEAVAVYMADASDRPDLLGVRGVDGRRAYRVRGGAR